MKVHARALLVALASMSLIAPATTSAQVVKRTGSDLLATLKTGQWIRLDGTLEKDQSVTCTEVKLLTGDFLDDEWSVRGVVRSLEPGKHGMVIGRYPVRVEDDAVFENTEGGFRGYEDLRVGMLVEVEGTYRKDRSFLATEVDDESDEDKGKNSQDRLRIVAKVERVDTAKRRITAMGTVFQLTSKTQVKSMLR